MKRSAIVLSIAALALAALPVGPASGRDTGRYIVVLKSSVADPGSVAAEHAREHSAAVSHVYGRALAGYSATIPGARLDAIRNDDRVAFVESDSLVFVSHHKPGHDKGGPNPDPTPSPSPSDPPPPPPPPPPPTCPGSQVVPWGIDRVGAPASSTLAGNCSGSVAVNIYVIDTGVDTGHADLNVVEHVKFAKGSNNDCNGHGTHVAGTIAARDNTSDVVGVAPGAPVTGIKVLGCNGSGWMSDVIAGVDWVTANAAAPAVANMSLSGGASTALDDAVESSVASGVTYAVAAGNEGSNACNRSPARAGTTAGVITVGATDASNNDPSWSNYGSCLDLWAPGVGVLSTLLGGGTTTYSGTSMASPHMAGGAALYLSSNAGASPAAVEAALRGAATTPGTFANDGAPIRLLQVGGF